jgi:predicted CxxxxCH...CXXCH cytochrome family protein
MIVRPALVMLLLAGCSTARPVEDGRRCASEADCATVHPPGIADPQSPDFHANLVVSIGYKLDTCAHCHGDDFSGGLSGKSCLGCHADGPTSCTTCHGQPPATGAHPTHARYDCSQCHVKPMVYTDVGHLFASDGSVIPTAQITFGALPTTDGAQPIWDGATCASVYCHGATLNDPAATHTTPRWTGGPPEASCGSCHGAPPTSHAGRNTTCSLCHPTGAPKHVDGKVDIGDGSGTCQACHPSPGGVHASHTQATHRIAAPLGCGECHLVPTSVDSPGHIDHPDPIVFPPGTSALARTDSANPTFTPAGATCSDVYCHGGGQLLAADSSPSIRRTLPWAPGGDGAVCGACHGIPPADGAHAPGLQLTDCHRCHRTVDASGALQPGTHVNGVVDGP